MKIHGMGNEDEFDPLAEEPKNFVIGPVLRVPIKAAIPGARLRKWPRLKKPGSATVTAVDYDKGEIVVTISIDGEKETSMPRRRKGE